MAEISKAVCRTDPDPVPLTVQPLWDCLDLAILVTDCDLEASGPGIRYANAAFTRLTGYRLDEVIGRSPRFLQERRTDRATVHGLKASLLDTGSARATMTIRRKDGTGSLCSVLITPLLGPTGQPTHFICVAQPVDIDARNLSDEYEQAMILIEDLEARHTEAEAVIARQHAELAQLNDRYRAVLEQADTLSEQVSLRERALDLRRNDFIQTEMELRAALEELRAMDEELRISLADIEESNAKLERTNESLRASQSANADKLRLLATASHDLRQPVMSLGLFLDVLSRRVAPDERPLLGVLMASHLSIRTLLDGMLDTARLDAGVLTPDFAVVPVDSLLESIRFEFSLQAEMRGVRFRVVGCSAKVISDTQLLERILRNLIGNALKYTERGGILVGCRRCGDRLRIEVWDTGPGIPKQSQEKIFEEFKQLNNPDSDQRRGVGLGLSIVARLAKQLGHKIGLRSRLGKGSVFSVTVPLAGQKHRRRGKARFAGDILPFFG